MYPIYQRECHVSFCYQAPMNLEEKKEKEKKKGVNYK
jgi:hypothetical protein